MEKVLIHKYESPCGALLLGSYAGRLILCDWDKEDRIEKTKRRLRRWIKAEYEDSTDRILEEAVARLDEYFDGILKEFDLPIEFHGTEFQKKVWKEVASIPYGGMVTYIDLARRIGCPDSVRAVANAVGSNSISIIVPCHRVVSSGGNPGGYAGGSFAKASLLDFERGPKI